MNVEELNVPMDVESVDVFASIEDYFCVQAFLSNISQPTMFLLDPQEFLDSFFTEPADLRLTMCAVSAALQTPRLPRTVCDNYYKRAMTAFSRSLDNPTLKTLQALMLMNTYVTMNGQPHLARNNFFTAVTFVEKLSLDVDPDDLELRTGVPIPPKEKYERRYWYHVMKYYLKIIKAVHSRNVLLDFRKGGPFVEFISHSVKLPVHPDSGVINDIYYAANIQELVSKAAALHKSMPMSIVDIIDSQPAALLRANLTALQLETPRGLIIHTPADLYVATTTYTPCNLVASLLASLHFHTVPCLLHRAKLYLTAFLPIDSAHLQRTGARETTLRALCDSVQSARMIAALNSWMALSAPPGLRKVFWRNHIFPCFCLFEAAVVLWFVTCKTREEWLAAAGDVGGLEWRREVRSGVMDVGRTLEELEGLLAGGPGGSENMMSPLVQCVLGMVAEMEKVEEAVSKGEGIPPVAVAGVGACSWEAGVNFVALGMKVMSIVEDDRVKPFVSDPWTFLGLMGVPVGGNLVWKAYYEDEWSFFWELVVNGRM
ncbi:hypothetical protein BC830DRAFT_662893 [Chytriomyces sp. MP71]|nr:hypothetical protein BC830DRAFT_662893 [Chytriomyces sp. MP71]